MDIRKIFVVLVSLFALAGGVFATQQQLDIVMSEYVNQSVLYNPLKAGSGIWYDTNENQSLYNVTGFITIKNVNPDGKDLADIYISIDQTKNISLPTFYAGRNGTFILNSTASNAILLHIPQLRNGENSTWKYIVNNSAIRSPLNFTSNYSATKVLAGNNLSVTDKIHNVFENYSYQTQTCIYGINITQVTVPVNFSGTFFNFYFVPSTIGGADSVNTAFESSNLSMNWTALAGGCLAKNVTTDISYNITTPLNIPKTTNYYMINSTLRYKLNSTISHIRITDIKAISEANLSFEKKIMGPSHPTLYGSNVTWNVSAYFTTGTNITYNLNQVTLWVSKRNVVAGQYTNPNTIDNDSISNKSLNITFNPFVLVNVTAPWASSSWTFNYSDIPSPIVWYDVNFTISNDGVQLINRSVTQNENDTYIKEIYLIIGYWLEIEKNITSVGNDTYTIKIDVHNKGNQVTPADTIVTIYDFVPSNYVNSSPFIYSSSTWYTTALANTTIAGAYNGTLYQWGLIPTNSINTSFAAGPAKNANTTWSVIFNVTGSGDYKLLDVFVTGLDPQLVDGAGSTKSVIVSEVIERIKSTEGIFAAVASVLLLLGLLI